MPKIIIRQKDPLPATAIVQTVSGEELAREDIASGAESIIKVGELYPSIIGENTTTDDEQLFAIIGDSNSDGRGTVVPTVNSDTLFLYNSNIFTEITTQWVSNFGGFGSAWQYFSTEYKKNSGYKTLLVNGALGGSRLHPGDVNGNSWMGSSLPFGNDLLTPFLNQIDNSLLFKDLQYPKAIMICGLGINDYASGLVTIENAIIAFNNMIDVLVNKYPKTPILYSTTGVTTLIGNTDFVLNDFLYKLRSAFIKRAKIEDNLHIVGSMQACAGALYVNNPDEIHINNDGLEYLGKSYARWHKNLNIIPNKWPRSIISSLFDDVDNNRLQLLSEEIEKQIKNGNYWLMDSWYIFKTNKKENIYLDFTFKGFLREVGTPLFNMNDSIETEGSISSMYEFPDQQNNTSPSSLSDFITGLFVKENTTGANNAGLFGSQSGATGRWLAQLGSGSTVSRVNDDSNTTVISSLIEANKLHAIARKNLRKIYVKDIDIISDIEENLTLDIASRPARIGGRFGASVYFKGKYTYLFKSNYSLFDLKAFFISMSHIIDKWRND